MKIVQTHLPSNPYRFQLGDFVRIFKLLGKDSVQSRNYGKWVKCP